MRVDAIWTSKCLPIEHRCECRIRKRPCRKVPHLAALPGLYQEQAVETASGIGAPHLATTRRSPWLDAVIAGFSGNHAVPGLCPHSRPHARSVDREDPHTQCRPTQTHGARSPTLPARPQPLPDHRRYERPWATFLTSDAEGRHSPTEPATAATGTRGHSGSRRSYTGRAGTAILAHSFRPN